MKVRWCCADGTGGRRATAAARGERWAYLKLEIRAADLQNLSWNCRWQVICEDCACFKWPNLTSCGMISMFKQVSTSPLAYEVAPNPRNRWFVVRGERVFGRWRTEDGDKKVSPGSLSPSPPPFTITAAFHLHRRLSPASIQPYAIDCRSLFLGPTPP
jgi:hypothetical protein